MKKNKKLIIQFNEANFDLIKEYCKKYDLKNLSKLFYHPINVTTTSEKKFQNLEPWIQWYSFYTGLSFDEHKTFHLGDCLKSNHSNFIEKIAEENDVAIFGSMNLRPNKNYKIYLPDPWTNIKSDDSFESKFVNDTVKIIINSNARLVLSYRNILGLIYIIGIPRSFKKIKIIFFVILAFLKKSRAELASYFDYLYLDYALRRSFKNNINTTLIFLNGLAHIQHHYLLSSTFIKSSNPEWYDKGEDLIFKSLLIYDKIFEKVNKISNLEVWTVTGITQEPHIEPICYWRFRNHKVLLKLFLDFNFEVIPLMTRDFEVIPKDTKDYSKLKDFLENAKILHLSEKVEYAFSHLDFSHKGKIFASFNHQSTSRDISLQWNEKTISLNDKLDFVAIKNGKHKEKGWAFCNSKNKKIPSKLPIWELFNYIV